MVFEGMSLVVTICHNSPAKVSRGFSNSDAICLKLALKKAIIDATIALFLKWEFRSEIKEKGAASNKHRGG